MGRYAERRTGGVRPGQKTFRAPTKLLDALEDRAALESIALGVDVGASDIIRRGIEWALSQPVPGLRPKAPCNVVPTASGSRTCLVCRSEVGPGSPCPRTGEVVSL